MSGQKVLFITCKKLLHITSEKVREMFGCFLRNEDAPDDFWKNGLEWSEHGRMNVLQDAAA